MTSPHPDDDRLRWPRLPTHQVGALGVSSTGAEQSFVVPAGVTALHVVAVGAKLVRTHGRTAKVRFRFSANAVRSSFLCKIDRNPFTGCQAPKVYDLSSGKHLFAVKAVKGGTVDMTPARFAFKIERLGRHGRHPRS